MAIFKKTPKQAEENSFAKINRVKPLTNALLSTFFIIMAICTVVPVLLVVSISISSSESLAFNGFAWIPFSRSAETAALNAGASELGAWVEGVLGSITFAAYEGLFKTGSQLIDCYKVTIVTTAVHTVLSVLTMAAFAFVLAQQRFSGKKFYSVYLLIPMLFSGGMVPSYIINVNYLHLYDSFWILVLPGMVNTFNVIVLRTFIQSTIPIEMFDAASIDGANEFRVFRSIVLPLSKAGLATIALFVMVGKWNEWFTGMLYIENPKLVPVQTMLTRIQQKLDFIKNNSDYASTMEGQMMIMNMPTEQTRMAILVLSTLPIIFAYPFFQRFFIQGLTIGSVKG
ncbi:MAG: carbohydrate ABC transporter permease [Clostridia bacterium]|nr:carbohydrate ABC transporter permease [Clostridia bacterium]